MGEPVVREWLRARTFAAEMDNVTVVQVQRWCKSGAEPRRVQAVGTVTVEHLGVAFRWMPCDVCGSYESDRLRIDTGDGHRTICRHVEACDTRARRFALRALRQRRHIRAISA